MKNYFAEKLTVNDTNIDFSYQAPIYEILKMIEAATFNHANLIGLDHETMDKQSNAFWIVTKIKLMLISPIKTGDKLKISTWTHTPSLVRFKRDFMVKVKNKQAVKGSSEWCCLDMTTHKLRKANSINYPDLEMVENSDVKTEYSNLKVEVEKKDYVYTYIVRSTDIDVNFHTNNLKYNFMTMNAFSVDELHSFDIKEYELYFVNESHEGDKIDIFKRKVRSYYYIEGRTGDKTIFKTIIKTKKRA